MATPDKDLEAVREQYDAVSGRLSKLALVSLSAILLLVIPFSRACRQISGEDVNRRVREINRLGERSGECPRLSYVFLLFPSRPVCDDRYSAVLEPSGGEATGAGDTGDEAATLPDAARPAGGQTQDAQPLPPEEIQRREAAAAAEAEKARGEALNRQRTLEAALDADARQLFTVKPSLLGADLEFDLRYWIFALPFVVWLSAIHLGILRKKLSLLRAVAAARLAADKDGGVAVVDRLAFARREGAGGAPFLSHPGKLEAIVYVLSVALAVAYLAASGFQFWRYWTPRVKLYLAETILLFSYFAFAYTRAVGGAMGAHAKEVLGVEPGQDLIGRAWRLLGRLARAVSRPGRSRPHVSLVTGSLLVLSTLFLAFASSCEERGAGDEVVPKMGYKLALGREDTFWYSGFFGGASAINLGRWYYLLCLGLALFTLVVVGTELARGPRLLRRARAASLAYRLAATLALYMLADVTYVPFSAAVIFSFSENIYAVDGVRVLAFLVPALLWNWGALSRRPGRRERWGRRRGVIAAVYLPGLALGAQETYLYVKGGFSGVPVFLAGIVLLALGYAGVYSGAVGLRGGAATVRTGGGGHEATSREST